MRTDDFARFTKSYLHNDLRQMREVVVWKIDGLAEYDIRRPLTRTGTNLLGLIKHLATWEARYLGEVFDRPYPGPLPSWSEDRGAADLWVTADESRAEILEFYRRASAHADDTIDALPIDTVGHVPWWPRPEVKLFNVLVHLITDTARHAGHADILREGLDGAVGAYRDQPVDADSEYWTDRRETIEQAARDATGSQSA